MGREVVGGEMKEILKRIKNKLTANLSGNNTIVIMPPDVAELVGSEIQQLPFIAIAPLGTQREVQSTRHILPTHTIQITVLDHFPEKEETIVGGSGVKGIIQHCQDIIDIIEFNTLDNYLIKGALSVTDITYRSLDRERQYFQIAIMTVLVHAPLETKT